MFRYHHEGAHVHVLVFAGPAREHRANVGRLVMRPDEWAELQRILQHTAWTGTTIEFEPEVAL